MFFEKQIRVVKSFRHVIVESIEEAITTWDGELTDYITKEQLRKLGQDGKGDPLGNYSISYANYRKSLGLQTDHVDLRLTGKFHSSIRIEAQKRQFKVVSNVPYDTKIIKRYGIDVLKIQQEFLRRFAERRIIPTIKKNLYGKIAKSVST